MNDNAKPDFKAGVPAGQIPDGGMLPGAVGDEDVLLIRRGTELFAVGAYCTHYHGPLAQGLIVGDTVRCPLHHACFSLRTGEALRAPALDPIDCWRVEQVDGKVMVRDKLAAAAPRTAVPGGATAAPDSVVIVGGGAAGLAAADSLRRYGYGGAVTLLSADESPPIDRPNLSKDFLAGTAPPEWIPLRTPEFYTQRKIDLIVGARVSAIDTKRQFVELAGGRRFDFGALLLATGAEPVRLDIPGAADSQICYLRTFADAKVILAKAAAARRVVVIGASFIGLEVAAALRTRDIEVHVVGPEEVPMARVLGEEAGRFIQGLHESRGVRFHLGTAVDTVAGKRVALADGTHLDADFLIVGVGVRPSVALAEQAGVALDRGVSVNEYLETSAPGVFAAGDIARWPDPHTGERIRVEHWVVAQRQGHTAAGNILGLGQKFDAVPFFWSQHYDVTLNYVGHAEHWDVAEVDGSLAARNASITYRRGGRTLAVVTVSRDVLSLQAELAMETATSIGGG